MAQSSGETISVPTVTYSSSPARRPRGTMLTAFRMCSSESMLMAVITRPEPSTTLRVKIFPSSAMAQRKDGTALSSTSWSACTAASTKGGKNSTGME